MASGPNWKPVSSSGNKSGASRGQKPAASASASGSKPATGRQGRSHNSTQKSSKTSEVRTRRASTQRRRKKAAPKPADRIKTWLKRTALALFSALLLLIFIGSVLFVYLYVKTEVPGPDKFAVAQTARVYYSDGETEIGKLGERNREVVELKDLPEYVGQAVIASEDRSFYSNSGIDPKGILRALTNNLLGGARQGGSTLSQQYAENYYLGRTTGYSDKIKEAILALKINRQQPKPEILINYLNTIYWGRGSYGIEAASQAYFGHPAAELTLSESVMLAGIIPAPSAYDPAVDPEKARQRFERVLQFMAEDGWIDQTQKESAKFPQTIEPKPALEGFEGTSGYLLQHVKAELLGNAGMSEEQIYSGGVKIVTTIDVKAQESAVEAVQALGERPTGNRVALSSVNPKTGAIIAEYGGDDYSEIQSNAVTQDIAVAGSVFKPFTLVAALQQGVSLNEVFNGNSPREFQGASVQNFGNESWGNVTLLNATANSINTPYVELNERIGPDKTRLAAIQAGIPAETLGLEDNLTNTLGTASPHNIDIAEAYATFASGGVRRTPHIIQEVTDQAGDVFYRASDEGEEAFSEDVIKRVNQALRAVMDYGTGTGASFDGRPMAGKSGSGQDNLGAWFVGYTPSVVTVVSMYQIGEGGSAESITPFGGFSEIVGSSLPKQVFEQFMRAVLAGTEIEQFPGAPIAPPPSPEPEETEEKEPDSNPQPAPAPSPSPNPVPNPDSETDSNGTEPGGNNSGNTGGNNGGNTGGNHSGNTGGNHGGNLPQPNPIPPPESGGTTDR